MTLPWNDARSWVSGDAWTADSGGTGGGGTADPATITGLIRRWRADSIAQADASAVSSWTALTGGVALTQATGTAQPSYRTAVVNSQPVVRFDGTSDYLTATITAQAQPTTLSVVLKWGSVAAAGQVVDAGHSQQLIILPAGWDGWAGVDLSNATTPTVGTWYVVTYVANGASSAIYLNGTSIASGNSGTSGLGASLFIAVQNNLTRFMNGDIAEVFAYSQALGTTDRSTLHSYVQDRYGITVSDYSSPTIISLADTGSGIGALTVGAVVPLADTGTGTGALSAGTPVSLADTGHATEALTVSVSLTDAGGAADALTVGAAVTLAESWHGTDAISAGVPISFADTGTGTDALTVTLRLIPLADAGAGTDGFIAIGPPVIAPGAVTVASSGIGSAVLASPGDGEAILASSGVGIATVQT